MILLFFIKIAADALYPVKLPSILLPVCGNHHIQLLLLRRCKCAVSSGLGVLHLTFQQYFSIRQMELFNTATTAVVPVFKKRTTAWWTSVLTSTSGSVMAIMSLSGAKICQWHRILLEFCQTTAGTVQWCCQTHLCFASERCVSSGSIIDRKNAILHC